MGRMLVIVTLLLGGACPVQLPSSHVILTSTQTLYDSYLISCTPAIPEEKVTQVHWKERRPDGKYNVIAVLNTVWGNATQLSYQLIVKLSKIDETTYTLEIAEAVRVVCCEVVTFPSGIVQENCLVLEGDSTPGGGNIESALLGTLLVSGFLVFGCLVLICHICWSKRSSRRTLNLSSTSREAWNRVERSRVPYTRTTPSVNHAYEPPIDADLLANEEAQRSHLPRAAPANQPAFEGPPTRVSHQYQITPPSNHWLSENSPNLDAPSYTASASVPPPRMNVIPEESSTENSIYSNVLRHNRPHQKMPHLQHSQNKPDVEQHQPQIFAHGSLPQPSPGNPFHTLSSSWQCGGTSIFSEGAGALQPTRLRVPRTPDSPFSTINPMYHSRPVWAPHPSNDSFNYEQTTIS